MTTNSARPNVVVESLSPHVRSLASVEHVRVDPTLHRLQWNESPFDFPPELKEEVMQRLAQAEWSRYPVTLRPFDLIDRLAATLGVPADRIAMTGGSSDMIRVLFAALVQPGDAVVMPSPTFLLYRRNARLHGADLLEVPCDAERDFALPVDDLIVAARTNQAKVVVLCAPNNPTGTVFPVAHLAQLVEECGCPVVIDEAYQEFSGQDLLSLASRHANVVLVRTFSKAFSMAGVRLGYAVAAAPVISELQKVITAFPLSLFTEIVAAVALENRVRFMQGVAQVVAERERLAAALAELPGVRVHSSGTNFLLVRPNVPARPIFEHLFRAHHLLISDAGGYPELDNYLRISVGTPEENDLVVRGFRECVG